MIIPPNTFKSAQEIFTYNRLVDALSAYRDDVSKDPIEVPQRFEEPKFVPKCVCGNDELKSLRFLQFAMEVINPYGYNAEGDLEVECVDTDHYHTPGEISIREDQVGIFLYCKKCKAHRALTEAEAQELAW